MLFCHRRDSLLFLLIRTEKFSLIFFLYSVNLI